MIEFLYQKNIPKIIFLLFQIVMLYLVNKMVNNTGNSDVVTYLYPGEAVYFLFWAIAL